jgi:glycerol-3-phosphate dehydrogenase
MMTPDWDVAIVGGGIHGAGVAQAAAAAGYQVALLEQTAWAAGTSSRSSKLIHGGLRYLRRGQLRLVRESLREREILLRIAPTLVRRNRFLVPVYRNSKIRSWQLRAGLAAYSALAGLRPGTGFTTLRRGSWDALDGLATAGLEQVFCYHDAQTDDRALTWAVVASAVELGAEARCPARLVGARRIARGYQLDFIEGAERRSATCAFLVNAAGPWVNRVRDLVDPPPPAAEVDLVQGTHLVLAPRLSECCYYLESPDDGRAVFVLPWQAGTLIGTTETLFRGEDPGRVVPAPAEREYLLRTLARYFPAYRARLTGEFAGLRVLPRVAARPFDRSREMRLVGDAATATAYLAVYGGKLTGYRASAESIVRVIATSLGSRSRRADTSTLPLRAPAPAA